jgi:subtilisin family serine protease
MMMVSRSSRLVIALLVAASLQAFGKEKERPSSPNRPATIATAGTMQIATGLVVVKLRDIARIAPNSSMTGIPSLDARAARYGIRSITPFVTAPALLSKAPATAAAAAVRSLVKISFDADVDPRLVARDLAGDPAVDYAEPYYVFPLQHTPNDPRLSQQWALAMMKMQEAWDVTTGDSTIIIGSVDSGVDWTHEDLSQAIYRNPGEWGTNGELSNNGIDDDGNGKIDDWHGWDFIGAGSAQSPQPDNNPMDGAIGHGTGTSACFGAAANNGLGIAGTSYRAKILAIKTGAEAASLGILAGYEGLLYAIDMNCRVINCSWGGTGAFSQAYQDIIDYAYSKGALVVGSSGNNPLDNDRQPHWPSSFNHVLNVGSIEASGAASNWCTFGTSVHVYAPGANVLTARRGGGYQNQTGTSFSSPLVSGLAALVFAKNPTWTPDQVMKQIRVTADGFTNPPQPKYFGRVNALKALTLNQTLTDIPGLHIKSHTITTPSGTRFTAPGQTARVDVVLENVLAPTSANATVTIEFEDSYVSTPNPTHVIGVLPTFGTKSITFDVVLASNPLTSEGVIPFRLKVVDGSHLDYLTESIEIYLDNGWHTALGNLNVPFFSSLHVRNESVVWASVDITQNSVSAQNYVFRTTNGGTQWFLAGASGQGGYPAAGSGTYSVFSTDALTAWIGTGPASGQAFVYRTVNGGQAWTGTSVASITPFVNVVHMFDAQNGIILGDPRNNVWGIGKTTNGGAAWSALASPLTAPTGEAGWNNSYDFIGDTGWFGTNNGKIYKTTDRGETWTAIPTPSTHSTDISFRDVNTGAVRFSRQGTTGTDTIAVTTDGGANWRLVSTITAAGSSMIMERGGKRMWVLRGGNAYESSDLGLTWSLQAVPGGFNPITVVSGYTTAQTAWIYAGGWNIYRFISPAQPVTSVSSPLLPLDLAIDAVYPQPARGGSTQVAFRLASSRSVQLGVYDLTGRLVRLVVDATLTSGAHHAQIATDALPAGSYTLRLTDGVHSRVQPLMIVR